MAIDSYAKLQSELSDTLNRTDLIADVTEFSGGTIEGAVQRGISKSERRCVRRLRTREFETSTAFSLSAGVETSQIPTDFASAKLFTLTSPVVSVLVGKDLTQLINDFPSTAAGTPNSFAPYGTNFYFRRVPDSAYTAKLFYYSIPTPLSGSNTSNVLLTKYPDLLFYGALLELTAHLEDDGRIQIWKGLFDEAVKDITDDNTANRWSGAPIRSSVDVRSIV